MICKNIGCPNIIKGPAYKASVFDERLVVDNERRKAKGRRFIPYERPHEELWCSSCYDRLEAYRYTFVIKRADPLTNQLEYERVPRVDGEGKRIEFDPAAQAVAAPVTEDLPPWAQKEEVSQDDEGQEETMQSTTPKTTKGRGKSKKTA